MLWSATVYGRHSAILPGFSLECNKEAVEPLDESDNFDSEDEEEEEEEEEEEVGDFSMLSRCSRWKSDCTARSIAAACAGEMPNATISAERTSRSLARSISLSMNTTT